jgi:release factor glutamine methyltransferase
VIDFSNLSIHQATARLTQNTDRTDAQALVLHVCASAGAGRAWLIAHSTDVLTAEQAQALAIATQRRMAGEPVAYITGQRGFYGLELSVDARVLDPRPDTETLVDWALGLNLPAQVRALDLGTGSGAIALALASQRPAWQVVATDASPDALNVAMANAQHLGLKLGLQLGLQLGLSVSFQHGDWYAALPPDQAFFDLIVSNPPYIADGDPHLAALKHEPALALTSGNDGLNAIREIIGGAPSWLKPAGWLGLEHGHDQAEAVRQLLQRHGFSNVGSAKDLGGNDRVSFGQWQNGAAN